MPNSEATHSETKMIIGMGEVDWIQVSEGRPAAVIRESIFVLLKPLLDNLPPNFKPDKQASAFFSCLEESGSKNNPS